MARRSPSFQTLKPASPGATRAAQGASRKQNTRCELLLRRALWHRGLRYRIAVADLPGRPDIVVSRQRLAVFCDGDFWHGRDLPARLARLAAGHNAPYWVAKIQGNVVRDQRNTDRLRELGWTVLRFWEKDILADPTAIAEKVLAAVTGDGPPRGP